MSRSRPRITLHFAQSLDGRIAREPGAPRAILSSPEGFVAAHRARAEHDAVLVGIHTVLLDDPVIVLHAQSKILNEPFPVDTGGEQET